ncbi:MAG: rubrerythrin [Burkholderiales bacterium]|nr:rubrerythrin [Burkholderiales bacterium]
MTAMRVTAGDPDAPAAGSAAPETLAELMANALAIELEAAERYGELADVMETHNNPEVATLFRRMQHIETLHAETIRNEMGWTGAPPAQAASLGEPEGPETAAYDDVHYLMQPYHALEIALAAEERALAFFTGLARAAAAAPVREAAERLAEEEREHVELVRQWMSRVPKPDHDWRTDPDPPRYTD